MGKSRRDQRQHRRKVAGTAKGLAEHGKRDKRRHRDRYAKTMTEHNHMTRDIKAQGECPRCDEILASHSRGE